MRNARITIREKLSGSGFRSDFDAIYENFYRDSIYIYICVEQNRSILRLFLGRIKRKNFHRISLQEEEE